MLRRIRPVLYKFAFGTNLSLSECQAVQNCSLDSLSEPALGTFHCRKAEELGSDPSAGGALDAMQAQSYEEPTIKQEGNKQTSLFCYRN